jgi:hypothetical protein
METFTMIWGTLSVGIVLLNQWIKSKYKADLPVVSYILAFVLNGLAIYGITIMLGMVWDWNTFWPVIKDAALVSLGAHSIAKTAEKNGIPVPLMAMKSNHVTN